MIKLRWAIAGFGLGTFIIALTVPHFFYVNIPCQDDWTLVPIVGRILDGKASFADFWSFRSEHRIFFPRLILCHWGAWTHWEMSLIPWLNLALLLVATICIYWLSGLAQRPFWKDHVFWLVCIFTFSFHAIKTVLWVIQFHTFLTVALAVLAITVIAEEPLSVKRWLIAVLLAGIATFSFGEGLALWFAIFPLLIAAKSSRHFLKIVFLWIGSAVFCFAVYFHGFPYYHHHPSIPFVIHDPLYTMRFFLDYVGALFFPFSTDLFGALGLLLFLIMAEDVYRRDRQNNLSKGLLAVILFVLGNAFIISLARSHYAILGAVVDRYIPVSCFLWASIVVWMVRKNRNPFFVSIPLFLIIFVISITPFHWKDQQENKEFLLATENILRKESQTEEELQSLFSEPRLVEKSILIMKKEKLSIFR